MVEHSATVLGPAYDAHEAHVEHYNNVAWWTMAGLVMLGSLVLCIAFVAESTALGVVGGLIVVAGMISLRVLNSMGYGASGEH